MPKPRRHFAATITILFAFGVAPALASEDGFTAPPNLTTMKAPYRRPASIPFATDNPYTPEAALLGRTLFFDARLSGSGSLACASCHNPSFGWEDGLKLSHGEGMRELSRHTPTILNAAWQKTFFWDGRAPSLEAQATGPIGNPREMNMDLATLPAKLASIPGYKAMFERAYPGEQISLTTITKALAVFERTVASAPSPFDAWLNGDENAISDSAKRGFVVFNGTASCAGCHSGWRFTDDAFHDIGLRGDDEGRASINKSSTFNSHAFKTPTLRNVARRAPYMHDGSLRDLDAVLAHYQSGGINRPSLSGLMQRIRISPSDAADLKAFLESLSEPARSFPTPTLPQ